MSKFSKDPLGTRMKENYENRYKLKLARRSHVIIRLDGKAFHTWTANLKRPFDMDFVSVMESTTASLMQNIEGAQLAYVQSDEISILLTDFTNLQTEAWFDNDQQKIVSISASYATGYFNQWKNETILRNKPIAFFDSRAFVIPSQSEVMNYFIWRARDCMRNSIMSVGQANFSHKELHGLNTDQIQEKLFQEKGINWSKYEDILKNGTFCFWEPSDTGRVLTAFHGDIRMSANKQIILDHIPYVPIWETAEIN